MVEQRIRNARVGGSSPLSGTISATPRLARRLRYGSRGLQRRDQAETFPIEPAVDQGRIFTYRLAVGLASLILETLWHTCRLRFVGLDAFRKLTQEQTAVVPVCWHQHLLLCGRFW